MGEIYYGKWGLSIENGVVEEKESEVEGLFDEQ